MRSGNMAEVLARWLEGRSIHLQKVKQYSVYYHSQIAAYSILPVTQSVLHMV